MSQRTQSRTRPRTGTPQRAVTRPRGSSTRTAGQPAKRTPWHWIAAGTAAAIAAGVGLVIIQQPEPDHHGVVAVVANVDQNEAGNGFTLVTPSVNAAAKQLAATGGGSLKIAVASGGAAEVVGSADLSVKRDGQPETDAPTRERVVAGRVQSAFAEAGTSLPATAGRAILPPFVAAASMAPPRGLEFDVYYVGFGLGTSDPADARVETAGDPSQVVAAIADQLPKLPGARLHLFFTAAQAPQQALNLATSNWRTVYWRQLAEAMGMTIVEIHDDNTPAEPRAGAAPAPVIANIPDPTPVPPGDPTPKPSPKPVTLGGADFLPDTATFVEPDAAKAALEPLVLTWQQRPGAYSGAVCVGRTARFGPAEESRALSKQRATAAAAILRAGRVSNVAAEGVGYDKPLPGYSPTDQHQRSVICQLRNN